MGRIAHRQVPRLDTLAIVVPDHQGRQVELGQVGPPPDWELEGRPELVVRRLTIKGVIRRVVTTDCIIFFV